MNIKRAETEELARRVAELTGGLARLSPQSEGGLADRLMRIGAAAAAIRSGKGISPEDLHDERGLSQ
jgi:hypothetical protein